MDTLALPPTGIDLGVACASCEDGLDHCHGTLITHDDADECTHARCHQPDPARHELRITCEELDSCRCTVPDTAELASAS